MKMFSFADVLRYPYHLKPCKRAILGCRTETGIMSQERESWEIIDYNCQIVYYYHITILHGLYLQFSNLVCDQGRILLEAQGPWVRQTTRQ